MDHPAVPQAVTFAMPHAMLGEDVAAAVVLREGASATEHELRDFVAVAAGGVQGAAQDRVPGRDPKGATGKLQRIGLAQKLGLG